jgi:lysozyme family protein
MANFTKIMGGILINEGFKDGKLGFVNHKNDRGKETLCGISRRWWSSWEGWKIVDEHKTKPNFPRNLAKNEQLICLIMEFYKENFYNKIGGEYINNDEIVKMLLDTAILEGFVPAIKRAQSIVGVPTTGRISNELLTKLNAL